MTSPYPDLSVRTAGPGDAAAIAAVFSPSVRLLTFLPRLHTVEEDSRFIAGRLLPECDVLVAEHDGRIISFLARDGEDIRLMHTHPEHIGRGAGHMLVERAKQSGVRALQAWCFQANVPARRFYERHGFHAVRFTNGAGNEEGMPDMLYRWEQPPA